MHASGIECRARRCRAQTRSNGVRRSVLRMKHPFRAFRRWWFPANGQIAPHETEFVNSDPPQLMNPSTLYVVTEDGVPWSVSLICPCGCGEKLHMNLLEDERPQWRHKQHWTGLSSLHPSIWRTKNCCAHFWFTRGRIAWCETQTSSTRTISSSPVSSNNKHWVA